MAFYIKVKNYVIQKDQEDFATIQVKINPLRMKLKAIISFDTLGEFEFLSNGESEDEFDSKIESFVEVKFNEYVNKCFVNGTGKYSPKELLKEIEKSLKTLALEKINTIEDLNLKEEKLIEVFEDYKFRVVWEDASDVITKSALLSLFNEAYQNVWNMIVDNHNRSKELLAKSERMYVDWLKDNMNSYSNYSSQSDWAKKQIEGLDSGLFFAEQGSPLDTLNLTSEERMERLDGIIEKGEIRKRAKERVIKLAKKGYFEAFR